MSHHANPNDLSESTPLLSAASDHRDIRTPLSSALPSFEAIHPRWSWVHILALFVGIAVISDAGEALYAVPRVRLFESIVCNRYYEQTDPTGLGLDGTVPEPLCKLDPIQDEVARILGWQYLFDSIPAILLPIPYGYLADKQGRKWILTWAMAGFALSYAFTLFAVRAINTMQYVGKSLS